MCIFDGRFGVLPKTTVLNALVDETNAYIVPVALRRYKDESGLLI